MNLNPLTRAFVGGTIQTIRTRRPGKKNSRGFVTIRLHDGRVFRISTGEDWVMTSSMLNTMRFRPKVTEITVVYGTEDATLSLRALAGYKVCEFIAVSRGKFPTSPPFRLEQVTDRG